MRDKAILGFALLGLILATSLVLPLQEAKGYSLLGWRWSYSKAKSLYYWVDSYLWTYFDGLAFWYAARSWERLVNGEVPQFFEVSYGEDITIFSYDGGNNGELAGCWSAYFWNGYYYEIYHSNIRVNKYYIETGYYYCFQQKQRVSAHEFGHTLGLADLAAPPDIYWLMYKYEVYGQTGVYTPQSDDINGLRAIYGNG